MDDLGPLVTLATDAALEAAALLRAGHRRGRATMETKSTLTDMVSELDRASERLLVDYLLRDRPDDAVLGEEGGARPGTSGLRWILDPLDGTTNYLYGFPAYAVSVAAEQDGEIVAAVVHDPVHGETFAAAAGLGARLDGDPITPSAVTDLAAALVGTGFSYQSEQRAWQGRAVAHLLPRVRDIRRAGAAALDLCWVACGRLDATYERGLAHWDHAAAALVVREAGGRAEIEADAAWPLTMSAAPGIADALFALARQAEEAAGPLPGTAPPGGAQ